MIYNRFIAWTLPACVLLAASCSSYKQNIMMKTPEGFKSEAITKEIREAERNYIIQRNDFLSIEVYTNKGERIIDTNPELSRPNDTNNGKNDEPIKYLVDLKGIVKFPVVGEMKVDSLTLRQAEAMLQVEYEKYFKESFVILKFENKRVTVLGAPGGQVIPLQNQNVNLAEILALAKGLNNDSKAHNIRVVRNEKVFLIDLSTIEGFQAGNMILEPGDIIYVEPVRRPFAEGLRDYAAIFSLFLSTLSLIIVVAK